MGVLSNAFVGQQATRKIYILTALIKNLMKITQIGMKHDKEVHFKEMQELLWEFYFLNIMWGLAKSGSGPLHNLMGLVIMASLGMNNGVIEGASIGSVIPH
ncbi:hypothetical protein ACJX0J_007858 [Zea mays]